jgi:hypothetical protein
MTMATFPTSGLTTDERAKFDRLGPRLAGAAAPGARLVFAGQNRRDGRVVGFVRGLAGPLVVQMPAGRFLAAPDDEVLAEFHQLFSRAPASGS